jgi:DNA (cytosine-5)-methyltransferase 1
MKVLDLFSGIGGFSLGLERAGMETVAFCEIEPFPRKVLAKHWPNVPIYEDVRELTYERLKSDGIIVDAITAGFPCQPYSRGNWRRQGRRDARDLSSEVVRLVSDIKPAVFVGENTQGFIDIGLESFADDLEEVGYFSECLSVPACSVGLPTLERHVWIVAATNRERSQGYIEKTIQNIEALQGQLPRSYQGTRDRWDASKPRVLRVGKGVSRSMDRDRVKALGNAVDPVIPELIGRAIMEHENAP